MVFIRHQSKFSSKSIIASSTKGTRDIGSQLTKTKTCLSLGELNALESYFQILLIKTEPSLTDPSLKTINQRLVTKTKKDFKK